MRKTMIAAAAAVFVLSTTGSGFALAQDAAANQPGQAVKDAKAANDVKAASADAKAASTDAKKETSVAKSKAKKAEKDAKTASDKANEAAKASIDANAAK